MLAGAWMDVAQNETNPFFQSFEQYFDQGNGAVSLSISAGLLVAA